MRARFEPKGFDVGVLYEIHHDLVFLFKAENGGAPEQVLSKQDCFVPLEKIDERGFQLVFCRLGSFYVDVQRPYKWVKAVT